MFMFLKSINGEDLNICSCFLPEINDSSHSLNKKYVYLKEELFLVSKRIILQKNKMGGKENRTWNKSRAFQKGFKSLLNSAKFLSKNQLISSNKKLDKQLFSLSTSLF